MTKLLVIALMLCAVTRMAFGVSCYVGTGGENLNDFTATDCGSDQCVKVDIQGLVARACLVGYSLESAVVSAGLSLIPNECRSASGIVVCVCTGELCNGSGRAYVGILLPLLVASIVGYFMS